MAPGKKKTRKELLKEPDEFITLSSRVLGWVTRFKDEITYALLGVVVLAAVVSGYVYYSNRQEAAAASLLAQALAKLERLSAEKPRDKAVQEVSENFRFIYNDYSGRANGSIARLIYANLCYETGDYQQAADLYRTSLPLFADQPLIHFQILKSLGYTYEALQDAAAAVTYFEQAQAAGERSLQDDVLFHLGELYAKLGQKDKSTETFKRILSDHPESVYANLVRQRVNG
ncbi:MAG: tetratricopeptide repeat protein [Hyphomicrobiales bacterium]